MRYDCDADAMAEGPDMINYQSQCQSFTFIERSYIKHAKSLAAIYCIKIPRINKYLKCTEPWNFTMHEVDTRIFKTYIICYFWSVFFTRIRLEYCSKRCSFVSLCWCFQLRSRFWQRLPGYEPACPPACNDLEVRETWRINVRGARVAAPGRGEYQVCYNRIPTRSSSTWDSGAQCVPQHLPLWLFISKRYGEFADFTILYLHSTHNMY
jgi:hypothetical protein